VNNQFFKLAVLLTCAGLVVLSRSACSRFAVDATGCVNADILIPTAANSHAWSLGYDQLLSDFYWLSFINYEGDGPARALDKYALCSAYLDLITSLDPHFAQAYWFTAFSVGADQGRPDLADKILKRGIAANPDNWYIPYIAGLNQYLFAHNESEAAKYYFMAARFPEAPHWLGGQAKILALKIPSVIKEIRTWDYIYRSNEPPKVRQRAKEQLVKLWLIVFKNAGNKEIRDKARHALNDLDYELN
jgi:hypothetical protein